MTTKLNLFITVFVVIALLGCNNEDGRILPKKTAITESVYASVTIQPDSLYQAYAAVAGILDHNLVEEGDTVMKGQPILQIINSSPKLGAENARLAYELAKENYNGSAAILKSIEEEIEAATLKFTNDSINYFRQQNLWNKKIGSKADYDNRKLAYELSRNNLQVLKSKYNRTQNELETQLKQAENNYKTSQIATEDFTVSSKIDGKVYALYKNPGEIVTTMEPLASLGRREVFIIEMLVDEVDIVKIRKGQKVIITLDAYNSEVFEAKVNKIYPKKDERSQTFTIEAVFMDPPEILYPGLAGEANIVIAQKSEALVIPKAYLMDGNQIQTEDGPITVDIGLQSLDEVEITNGLEADTYILKPSQ
ncbi:efflux RND transporter periplasmic adaptor subunit [Flagellimonas allohymeniacidonis]|uniref:HlyD family efflux transporter periplasmic adaptor subunit n=1 Tax=Flagellimonas allohymeniacidonis TaxID=2517819 RepID=A0A4Q8QJ07_9FLAO|nr:efflux RND transporter periplasmic adaptor subunit [Allomuricauda hymeniacidonis]TAI48439.1 HlyD family efflux transporter periplasmic adaptor subunit [Allomuricauda hymeniacidonis]